MGAMVAVFMIAGFSFQGTELIGIAAGESEDPEKNIPKAINTVFWRILVFYIGALGIISFLIPYTNPNLLKNDVQDFAVSPFTLVLEEAGLVYAASLMNAVILTSVLSAANSGLYASARMLYAMAGEGKAPALFMRLNRRSVPVNAILLTAACGFLAFITSLVGEGMAYQWLVNATGVIGLIAWLGIALSHYRFRRAFIIQGRDPREMPYRALWFPFGPIFSLVLCATVIGGQGWGALTGETIKWHDLAMAYIGVPLFLASYLGYKFIRKTKRIPLSQVDISREP